MTTTNRKWTACRGDYTYTVEEADISSDLIIAFRASGLPCFAQFLSTYASKLYDMIIEHGERSPSRQWYAVSPDGTRSELDIFDLFDDTGADDIIDRASLSAYLEEFGSKLLVV